MIYNGSGRQGKQGGYGEEMEEDKRGDKKGSDRGKNNLSVVRWGPRLAALQRKEKMEFESNLKLGYL